MYINYLIFKHFTATNKAAAYISYRFKDYDSVSYYLSEAHGGGIRSKLSLIMNPE